MSDNYLYIFGYYKLLSIGSLYTFYGRPIHLKCSWLDKFYSHVSFPELHVWAWTIDYQLHTIQSHCNVWTKQKQSRIELQDQQLHS